MENFDITHDIDRVKILFLYGIICEVVIYMSKYKVESYIRLSKDESYSNSDSIDNQIKLTDFYCEENNLEVIDLLNIKKLDGESILN